jgi:alpha-glutamyl/putrescinyl thymine pyrophosphorylase clade 1
MAVTAWIRRRLPQATPVFDSLWYLAAERQRIFRARLRSMPEPLTGDTVLQAFKFTNAYRASDRTSQYLIRHVIYERPRPWRDTFVRVLLFKLFNRIETWKTIADRVGEITAGTFDEAVIAAVLEEAMRDGHRIYSAAYIMPSAQSFGSPRKHVNHLRLLQAMMDDRADAKLAAATSMRAAFDALVAYPSIGPFLGYQLATDLNYAEDLHFREDEFVVPGPGALDGLAKCFEDPGDLAPAEIIRWTMETQAEQFEARDVAFHDLWDRPLQLIDCQNLYCEVDKYARAAHPEFVGRTRRTRIKQRFRPRGEPLTAWYPPKWGLNDRVERWLASTGPVSANR